MNPLELKDQGDHSETRTNGWLRCVLQFLKKTKLHTKLLPEIVH